MITIQGKTLGRTKPLFANWSIPFPPDLHEGGDRLTLRDLIARLVRGEAQAFQQRQQERRLVRVLSAADMARGAAAGKIDSGGRDLKQEVDEEGAIAAALQAFEDGLYLVILDGEEQPELDREVYLRPDSAVAFVRLTLLAGG